MSASISASGITGVNTPGRKHPAGRTVLIAALTGVLIVLALAGLAINLFSPPSDGQWRVSQIAYLTDGVWFTAVGGFLILRVPGNQTGRALFVVGITTTSSNWVQGLLNAHKHGRAVPAGVVAWAAWLDNWTWLFAFGALFVLLLYFPDGRQPGRFWRPVEYSVYTALGIAVLICASIPESFDYPGVRPAVSFGPASSWAKGTLVTLVNGWLLGYFGLVMIALVISLVIRWWRSRGAQRAQLKWLIAGAGVFIALDTSFTLIDTLTGSSVDDVGLADLASQLAIWLIPLAIGVAVTRHGLFEIDRLVSRTVSYAVVVALLVGAYVLIAAGASALMPDRWGSVPVVLATLAVSTLFLPVRRWVVRVVDHRFNRSKYDAAAVVAQFVERVRRGAGQGTTSEDLVAAARQVLQPAHASVWLRPPMAPAASSPAGSIGSSGSYASGERA